MSARSSRHFRDGAFLFAVAAVLIALGAFADVGRAQGVSSAGSAARNGAPLFLRADRHYDGTADRIGGPVRVLVANGRIAAMGPDLEPPPGAVVYDLEGMTLLPGFIDAHTHLSYLWRDTTAAPNYLSDYLGSPIVTAFEAARNARATLRAGFTTIREMGAPDGIDLALAEAVRRGLVEGPRIVTAGPLYPPFGGRSDMEWPPGGTVRTEADIAAKTRDYIGQGADWIKLYATGGTYDDTTGAPFFTAREIAAAVDVAHPRGRWVAAHAMGLEGARRAVAAGVRSIEHGSRLDDAVAKEMAKKNIFLVPTLYHLEWYARHGAALGYGPGYAERLAALGAIQRESIERARKAGVDIVCGSDAVYTMHGENAWEIVALHRAGLTATEALAAATGTAARLLGLESDIGRLAPGFAADLVVVAGDPTLDITAVTRPKLVIAGGRIVRNDLGN
jgi:imidazolonepropionase-like amidohydrolase